MEVLPSSNVRNAGASDKSNDSLIKQTDCLISKNSLSIENIINNIEEGELTVSEPTWLGGDEPMAVWVKLNGKWQSGIKCERADWPSSTLKEKPTDDGKKYILIFNPNTSSFSWADMLLIRPINEFPQPNEYATHLEGQETANNLTSARLFLLQNLTTDMLTIVDQLHSNALVDAARNVTIWKQFAMEASQCYGYSHIGRMLLMLKNSIVVQYINVEWILHSSNSWVKRCQNANSAESVELLKEELFDSILWNDVNALWGAPQQPRLIASEWETWKHDVIRWFSSYSPFANYRKAMHQASHDRVLRKRAKLMVRRPDTHATLVRNMCFEHTISLENDPSFSKNQEPLQALVVSETPNQPDLSSSIAPVAMDLVPCTDSELVVADIDSETLHNNGLMELTPVDKIAKKTKNPQCVSYIPAKGRQCARLATGGNIYCCAHSPTRYLHRAGKSQEPVTVLTPYCGGITVAGTKCKHRSTPGYSFCKKHWNQDEVYHTPSSSNRTRKRKSGVCKDMVPLDAENPLQVVHGDNYLLEEDNLSYNDVYAIEPLQCIGSPDDGNEIEEEVCWEEPRWHFLYCDKHLPCWLRQYHARNQKMSKIISKDVFIELLGECCSLKQKVHLHKACALFYKLIRSILSEKNTVPKEVQFQWALNEASEEEGVRNFFNKLVRVEKENMESVCGFSGDIERSLLMEGPSHLPSTTNDSGDGDANVIKCKICSVEFLDDEALGTHWMENHKKESHWLFRGYACAICLDSFTNKKMLVKHVSERHNVKFVEHCLLVQCIPCGSHLGNVEELWLHVLSAHPDEFKQPKAPKRRTLSTNEGSLKKSDHEKEANNSQKKPSGSGKFTCKQCGLKFNLLPDLGRHHQASHMERNQDGMNSGKKTGIHFQAQRLKSSRVSRPTFKKVMAEKSNKSKSRANANSKKRIRETKLLEVEETTKQPYVNETNIVELEENRNLEIAKNLSSQPQNSTPQPKNLDILSIAQSACCKISLKASLEEKYGTMPENIYLKAVKVCSEHDIAINWHKEGFICPRGCMVSKDQRQLIPLLESLSNGFHNPTSLSISNPASDEIEQDEVHDVVNSNHLELDSSEKVVVLCEDISFGKESVPVVCVVDKEILDSLRSHESDEHLSRPWESFTYVTKPIMVHQSLDLYPESQQLRCSCSFSTCYPRYCDHVYLFDTDFDGARDIYGEPMCGRFPYAYNGRIILEEGYLVYECNHMCGCDATCQNRILQNGIRVKLEVFKTEKKGWAVRAGEAISRGTFVCEYIGEVLGEQEAHKRSRRYGKEDCSYIYDIDAHVNYMSKLTEEQPRYAIDSTRYGNVSRFINSSCSPNLVSYQVLVESMDCERSHIGFYANRDIAMGEELTFNYQYELVPGEGSPCLCGSPKCRGRLY